MARTLGSKNKPKTVGVKLSDLISKLNPDSEIPVGIEFAQALLNRKYTIISINNEEIIKEDESTKSIPAEMTVPTVKVLSNLE